MRFRDAGLLAAVTLAFACGGDDHDSGAMSDAAPRSDAAPSPDAAAPPSRFELVWIANLAGQPFATPLAMNEARVVTGYAGEDPWGVFSRAITITDGTATELLTGEPPSFGIGIDDAGRVVGESQRQATLWDEAGAHLLDVPAGFFSASAHASRAGGVIVGSYADQDDAVPVGPRHAYWTDRDAPAMPLLGIDGSVIGSAWAINDKGQIAGVSGGSEGVFYAVRWDSPSAAPVQIGPLPGAFNSEARGINAAGDVVGRSSSDTSTHAFVHHAATNALVALPQLPTAALSFAEAYDINDAGWIVGVANAGDGVVHGVLWIDELVYDLDLLVEDAAVAEITTAVAVTTAGEIAAGAGLRDGTHAVVLLRPVAASR
jgi:probable HAF family extracellular repeat protein